MLGAKRRVRLIDRTRQALGGCRQQRCCRRDALEMPVVLALHCWKGGRVGCLVWLAGPTKHGAVGLRTELLQVRGATLRLVPAILGGSFAVCP